MAASSPYPSPASGEGIDRVRGYFKNPNGGAYSGWMPASLTILPHLPTWSPAKSWSSLGELETPPTPAWESLASPWGLWMIWRSPGWSSSMMSEGAPAGAKIAAQESMSKPLTPASSSVGSSGMRVERLSRVTASARSLPALTCGKAVVRSANIIDTRPASTSLRAGGTLLYGTCSMSTSAQCLSVSPATTPDVLPLANESLPGFALAYAISSLTVVAGISGLTQSISV